LDSMNVSLIVFASVFGGAMLGMLVRRLLAEHHLTTETKDVVKLGMGMVGTMTALVLGLLVASAKSAFDSQTTGLAQLSANLGLLDRTLAHYGPETKALRQSLRAAMREILDSYWTKDGSSSAVNRAPSDLGTLFEQIQALSPKTDLQRTSQTTSMNLAQQIGQTRWNMYAQNGNTIPTQFLGILICWLSLLFLSFSMFCKPNVVVVATLLVSAASMAMAIFLILELNRPFDGIIRVSPAPLRQTLENLGP